MLTSWIHSANIAKSHGLLDLFKNVAALKLEHASDSGQKALRADVTATVATASLAAGSLVAVFAAKSLGVALAGTLGFIAISNPLDPPFAARPLLLVQQHPTILSHSGKHITGKLPGQEGEGVWRGMMDVQPSSCKDRGSSTKMTAEDNDPDLHKIGLMASVCSVCYLK